MIISGDVVYLESGADWGSVVNVPCSENILSKPDDFDESQEVFVGRQIRN